MRTIAFPSNSTSSRTRPARQRSGSCWRSRRSSRTSRSRRSGTLAWRTSTTSMIAVQQARGRPAVMVYTLVEPAMRDAMRQLCRRARVHYCDLLGHPIDSVSRVAGVAARMEPGARAPLDATYFKRIEAIEFAVKYDDGVGQRARRGGRRPRRRLAHVEDAALDLPRLPRPQGGERARRARHRAARGAVRDRPCKDRRAHDRRRSGSRTSARRA